MRNCVVLSWRFCTLGPTLEMLIVIFAEAVQANTTQVFFISQISYNLCRLDSLRDKTAVNLRDLFLYKASSAHDTHQCVQCNELNISHFSVSSVVGLVCLKLWMYKRRCLEEREVCLWQCCFWVHNGFCITGFLWGQSLEPALNNYISRNSFFLLKIISKTYIQ